jgi:hypothetical protein
MKLFKSREQKEQVDASRAEWDEFVQTASSGGPAAVRSALARLTRSPNIAALSDKERRERGDAAFRQFAENVLADDHLTEEEEAVFDAVSGGLGITQDDLAGRFLPILQRLMIAAANDGRLRMMDSPNLLAKRNEVVHMETAAGLVKEVVQREWRSRSTGYSFRVMKGVRYRVGQSRGHSVAVGTQLVTEDTGVLSVTSQRAVYVGATKTLEFAYAKLVGMEVFMDGIRLSVSNRQKATLLNLGQGMGDVVAATINAAMQV